MDIARRVGFYERISRNRIVTIERFPFYLVQYKGAVAKLFEPVDCKVDFGQDRKSKLVHNEQEFAGKSQLFHCEQSGMQLHKFEAWGIPA